MKLQGRGGQKSMKFFARTSQPLFITAKTRFILEPGSDSMGRNKEPIRLILAKGNKAHKTKQEISERKKQEVPVVADDIRPPAFLTTKSEKEKFERIAETLMEIGILSNLDCDVLGRYIRASEDWTAYSKLVKNTQKQLNKYLNDDDTEKVAQYTDLLTKYESLRVKAFNQCHTCASALGLTITSRCKIVVPKKNDEPKPNKYTEFIS